MYRVTDTKTRQRQAVLEKLLAGDPEEFAVLVQTESERLFRVIRRFVSDEDEARSVMQETFLQAFERRHTFRGEAKFSTWLYAIGINLARGAARKAARTSTLTEADFERLQPEFAANGMPTRSPRSWNPAKILESRERVSLVRSAIDKLPDDYRMVVTLRDIEELPTSDVAKMLEISEGAVRVRLHRARQALRALLSEHFSG